MAEKVKAQIVEKDIELASLINREVIDNAVLKMSSAIEQVKIKTDTASKINIERSSLRDLRGYLADLNGVKNEYDEARRELKRELNKPYALVESRGAELLQPLNDTIAKFKAARNEKDAQAKQARREAMFAHYQEYAGVLVNRVDFSAICESSWLNKAGWNDIDGELINKKAFEELEGKIEHIAKDYEKLKSYQEQGILLCGAETENYFFGCLDFGAAIDWDMQHAEELKKTKELKKNVAEIQAAQNTETQVVQNSENSTKNAAEQNVQNAEIAQNYTLTITATKSQLNALIAYLKTYDIHGKVLKA